MMKFPTWQAERMKPPVAECGKFIHQYKKVFSFKETHEVIDFHLLENNAMAQLKVKCETKLKKKNVLPKPWKVQYYNKQQQYCHNIPQ